MLQSECFWISTLNILSPLGLNEDFYCDLYISSSAVIIEDVFFNNKNIALFLLLYNVLQHMSKKVGYLISICSVYPYVDCFIYFVY